MGPAWVLYGIDNDDDDNGDDDGDDDGLVLAVGTPLQRCQTCSCHSNQLTAGGINGWGSTNH